MKRKILHFWCNNLYPFCEMEKTVNDFKIDKNGDYQKIDISLNEHLNNRCIRERNIKALKDKGGIKKYLINWIMLAFLYNGIVFGIIQPQTFWVKLPFVATNFIFASAVFVLAILYFMIDRNKTCK